jgi:beta-lactamase class C
MTVLARCLTSLALASLPACCVSTGSPAAAERDRLGAAVDRAIRPLLDEHGAPGVAVAVTVGGRSQVYCFGVAARATGVPVTPDTLFEIGSISKTFTATVFCQAEARGLIAREDHPGKYLPRLRQTAIDGASLVHLGTYTAGGLPLQFPSTVTNDAEMLDYFRHWTASAAPGTERLYSNPSIGLLGHVTAVASNRSFADLMERELLPMLGLRHTFLRMPDAEMANYAWGHDQAGKPLRVSPGVLDAEAYGLKSTASDLIRFVEINLRPDRLDAPIRQAIEATHVGCFRVGAMTQGLGWEQYAYPVPLEELLAGNSAAMRGSAHAATPITPPRICSEPTLFDKTGSTNGFGAYVAFVPAQGIGVVILANRSIPIPARIAAAHAVLAELAAIGR